MLDGCLTDPMNRFHTIKEPTLERLRNHLPKSLYYHGVHHTSDVIQSALRLAEAEGATETEKEWLAVAALYHDIGFLVHSDNHEHIGADMARKELPEAGFTPEEIERIASMILATRYPQQPNNTLEQILCDADLDYLGRSDFYSIGATLYRELLETGRISTENEWNRLQVSFLNSHHYFTRTALETREPLKQQHLAHVRTLAGA